MLEVFIDNNFSEGVISSAGDRGGRNFYINRNILVPHSGS